MSNINRKIYFTLYCILIITLSVITFHSTQDYYKFFHLGKSAIKNQDFKNATLVLEKAFQINPTANSAKLLVRSALQTDTCEKAIPPLELLHKKFPSDIEIFELLADSYYKMLQLDDAEKSYREILKINAKSKSVRRKLAEILSAKEQNEEAIVILSALSNEYPDNQNYRELLGDTHSFVKKYDEAISIYKKLLNENYKPQSISLKIADILRFQGKDDEAIKYYKYEKNN